MNGTVKLKETTLDKAIKFSQEFDFILRSKKKIYERDIFGWVYFHQKNL